MIAERDNVLSGVKIRQGQESVGVQQVVVRFPMALLNAVLQGWSLIDLSNKQDLLVSCDALVQVLTIGFWG